MERDVHSSESTRRNTTSRRQFLRLAGLGIAGASLLSACAPAAPSAPTSKPAAPTAKPADQPTAKPAAQPTASAAKTETKPSVPASSTAEWDQLVAAAKREGKLAIIGPTGPARRDSLVVPFETEYGITVEYLAEAGAGIPPRLTSERGAGQYLWDVVVAGALEVLLLPMNALAPIEANLVLAENKDPKLWRGGEMEFLDDERTILVMTPFRRGTLFVNPGEMEDTKLTSYRDLLDPQWKGKLGVDDPRRAGPGQATFTFFFLHPDLGPDFIRALYQQDLTLYRDYAQEVDAVGQGRHPIVIGTSDSLVEERISQGVPIEIVDPRTLKEGSDVSPASGMVGLFERPANRNAAKLYLNWLLSKAGQTSFAQGARYPSARLDVSTDHLPAWRIPQSGDIKTYGLGPRERLDNEINPLLTELFGQS